MAYGDYTYEARGQLSQNSFLRKPQWSTTTNGLAIPSRPYMGESTGGSPYTCESVGVPGVPHIPKMGNQFWGIGYLPDRPDRDKRYADDCAICGTRIVNEFSVQTWRWEGWRPTATVPPDCIIEEIPW